MSESTEQCSICFESREQARRDYGALRHDRDVNTIAVIFTLPCVAPGINSTGVGQTQRSRKRGNEDEGAGIELERSGRATEQMKRNGVIAS